MKKFVITIGREYGSGGRIIGEKLAKRLGVNFYDKNMIDKIAEESGFTKEAVEALDGKKTSSFLYSLFMSTQPVTLSDTLFKAQTDIIRDLVSKESCVIVGRCADYILKDREDCVNVFIHGEMKNKLERIKRIYNLSTKEAEKLIQETDRKRSINYKYYTEQIWGKSQNYTLTLNSSKLGYDKVIDIICNL